MKTTERRYDIDWLRVIAIGLLLIYHIGIAFQPWGVFIGFIQSNEPLDSLWAPMSLLNIWRIPLLFFVSGMGVCFAMAKRNWKQLLGERSRRILLPFVFGALVIVPIHLFIWLKYYSQDLKYLPRPGHLWFLGNIFIYVLVLSPLFFYLKNNRDGKAGRWIRRLFGNFPGLLIVVAGFVAESQLVQSETFATFALNLHGLLIGFLAFLFGFLFIYSGEDFWKMLARWKWGLLLLAIALFIIRLKAFHLEAPRYYSAIEACAWIFAVFGLANTYLKKPGRSLEYLSSAAYPVYILHMVFLYLASSLFFPMQISTVLQFVLVTVFTFGGCFGSYELIRRVRILRPLFGLKKPGRSGSAGVLRQQPVPAATSCS